MNDWYLEQETERINEDNRHYFAELAARLVISGWERHAAAKAIKHVNSMRDEYYGNEMVHIIGEEDDPDTWLLAECNYPSDIKGVFDKYQVRAITIEMLIYFE
ncbi:hypothetical protein [Pectobacterium punjabense]|uniref:hypothetical protein n=1 Tax=Pectobacterium punjabense TaxID=2108399 RepID=UPI0019696595|nr:hypothetical protein [Pectobacterium punjabense]MBN3137436.1 hypothetical protein [Pectobacterium punjabense]MCE5380450.1 hypothetical protein [Pectobacterium punjabense]